MWGALLAVALAATPQDILVRHECHRCHEVEAVAPLPVKQSCAGCHQDISSAAGDAKRMAEGAKRYGAAWTRFVERTGGRYCHVPPLVQMERFDGAWLRAFLMAPYDLRPNLGESMIRHNLSDAEVEALVVGWGAKVVDRSSEKAPSKERLARGAAVFDRAGCGTCHLFGNHRSVTAPRGFVFTPRKRERALAPDLRHARHRLARQTVSKLLADPKAVNPKAEMPRLSLSEEDREAVADFIYFAEPGTPGTPKPSRPVAHDPKAPTPTYEEVERAVFRKVCWHCHSDPDFNDGDGGPGNSGGLGFKGRGLSFADYESVMNGSLDDAGKRRSVLRIGVTGEPVLLERLRLRYVENDRDFIRPGEDALLDHRAPASSRPRGMPLGLPALTAEEFSLVERWVKGGAPGPSSTGP